MSNDLASLIQEFFEAIKSVVDQIWEWIFGDIDLTVLFSWCPSDIQSAVEIFIYVLFLLVIIRFIRNFLPF